jgi:hypothetical protein
MSSYWTVTGDLPDQFSTTGSATPVIGHVISFQTTSGNRGTVFIPNDHYTAAQVKKAVQVQADLTDEINSLAHHA